MYNDRPETCYDISSKIEIIFATLQMVPYQRNPLGKITTVVTGEVFK